MQKLKVLGAPRWIFGAMQPTILRIGHASTVSTATNEVGPDYADSVATEEWPAAWML